MPFGREFPPRAEADLAPLDTRFFEPPPDCVDLELVFLEAVPPDDDFALVDRAPVEAFVFELPVFEPEDLLSVPFEAADPRADELFADDLDLDDPAADLDLPAFDAADLVDVDLDDEDFDADDFFEPDFAELDFEVEDFFVVAISSFLRLVLFLKNVRGAFCK